MRGDVQGVKKVVFSRSKLRHILKSSNKVIYGSDTKVRYTASQWIEEEALKIGKNIHLKICRLGGERRVKI